MALVLKKTCSYLSETYDSLRKQQGWAACDGLRAIAVLWVCGGHAVFMDMKESLPGWQGLLMPFSKDVAVDLFFVLSGFLIGSALQREMTKSRGQMSWIVFYVRRFFRIVPAYASACLCEWIFLNLVDVRNISSTDRESCTTLWRNALFINNFFVPQPACMSQSWSIAVEMQLYVMTPPLFFLSQKLGKVWSVPWIHVLCASIWLTCCILRLIHVIALGDSMTDFDPALYFFTQYRCAPYIAGVSAGVAMTNALAKDASTSLPRQDSRLIAALKYMATVCSFVICLLAWFNGGDFKVVVDGSAIRQLVPNPVILVLIGSLLRPMLGVAVACLLASCINGQAPRLNAFLSARFWCPIAGLSYSMYIMEGMGQWAVSDHFLEATKHLAEASLPVRCMRGYVAIALYIVAAMLLAILNFTLAERPGMLLGKRVVSALKNCLESASSAATSKEKDLESGLEPAAVPSIYPLFVPAQATPQACPQQWGKPLLKTRNPLLKTRTGYFQRQPLLLRSKTC